MRMRRAGPRYPGSQPAPCHTQSKPSRFNSLPRGGERNDVSCSLLSPQPPLPSQSRERTWAPRPPPCSKPSSSHFLTKAKKRC